MRGSDSIKVAVLFVERGGVYWNLAHIDPWDRDRDARNYAGPYPCLAHPPCERWGRYWGGSPTTWPRLKLGDDGGCFKAALNAVRKWGGVLEHPEGSHAWRRFDIIAPPRDGGWVSAGIFHPDAWTCCVEQGHYGHLSRKATWLYASGVPLPDLRWGPAPQRLAPSMLAKHGYAKARRVGVMALLSSKDPRRSATPIEFRDLLISIASSASGGDHSHPAPKARASAARAGAPLTPVGAPAHPIADEVR